MNSIRARLLTWLMIPLVVIAAFVSLETFTSARKVSDELNDRTLLAATLTILENVIASDGTLIADETLRTLTDNLGDRFFYHVTGPNGAFVTGYSQYPRAPEDTEVQIGEPLYFDGNHQGQLVRVIQLKQDLTGRALSGVTTITTWQRVTKRAELTLDLFARSLTRLAILVLSAGAIVWFAVTIGLRPLANLQQAIDQRTPHDLNPIKRKMPVELKGIVGSMNDLFERVAISKKNRERFIGDAAHQLRNPVAAMKIQAETALDTDAKTSMRTGLISILEVANHSSGMINKMLSGATAHALDREKEDEHNLVELVEGVTLDLATKAFEKGQDISFCCEREIILFRCNPVLMREAISNLINNAIEHNEPKAIIEVGIHAQTDQIKIAVSDSGRAFSEKEFLVLTQPFKTRDETSSGSGLGLSISKDIAKSHGGYLEIVPQSNGGKTISIILPSH